MSAFKEQVAADITEVFLNIDEFGEEHDLNGTTCTCVVQSPTAQETFLQGLKYREYEDIHGQVVIVHCRKDDLDEVPVEGIRFDLDGEIYLVDSCVDDMGMLSITLHGNMIGG